VVGNPETEPKTFPFGSRRLTRPQPVIIVGLCRVPKTFSHKMGLEDVGLQKTRHQSVTKNRLLSGCFEVSGVAEKQDGQRTLGC
jgi:hypothetical protein